jgi:NAD(P)-dependent dehydrogenase (short-subunit alcohol dehydrogenase family)
MIMTESYQREALVSEPEVTLIDGRGPGIIASCARLFAKNIMRLAIAARNADKALLLNLQKTIGVGRRAIQAT